MSKDYNEPWEEGLIRDLDNVYLNGYIGIADSGSNEIVVHRDPEDPCDKGDIELQRRIIACVNFCAGTDNESLAEMKSLKEIEEFVQSRDKDWLELNAEKEKLEKSIDAAAKYIYARCRYPHVTSAEAIRELLINEPEGVLKEIVEDSDQEENV